MIHKSSSSVGYRPNVFSTTLSHLIATNSSHFLLPFVSIRGFIFFHFINSTYIDVSLFLILVLVPIAERLKEKVEEFFGCEYELVIEFTGLIRFCSEFSIVSIATTIFSECMNSTMHVFAYIWGYIAA